MREGWEYTTLNEVTLPKNNIKWDRVQGNREYIDLSSVDRDKLEILETSTVNSKNAPSRAKQIVHEGDVLFGTTRPQLKRVTTVPSEYHEQICSTGFTILRSNPDRIISEYIFYLLQSEAFMDEMSKLERGTSYPAVTDKDVKGFEFNLPLLPEQKRIVAVLDKAFEAIDQAKANIEQNIENAEELFQSKLNEIFSQKGEGWEEQPLGELTYVKSGGTPRRSTKEYWENGSIPWYSSGELNELYTTDSEDLITEKGLDGSNAKLFPKGSLLIGMYDTAALKMSILDRDGTFNQAISGAKPNEDLNLQFVMYAINAIKPEIMKQRRGVRQKNLNLTKIKAIPIPFPKIKVQNEVVAHLSELHDYTDTLIESYQNKLEDLEELKKSILQKAFSGELTANEHVAA